MLQRIFYSEHLKDAFIRDIRKAGHTILSVEKDFVGVWTVFFEEW